MLVKVPSATEWKTPFRSVSSGWSSLSSKANRHEAASHLSCTGNRHEATYDWTVKSIPGRKPVELSTARTTRETYAYPLHPKVVAFHLGDFVQDVQWVGADHPKVTQERYDTLIL